MRDATVGPESPPAIGFDHRALGSLRPSGPLQIELLEILFEQNFGAHTFGELKGLARLDARQGRAYRGAGEQVREAYRSTQGTLLMRWTGGRWTAARAGQQEHGGQHAQEGRSAVSAHVVLALSLAAFMDFFTGQRGSKGIRAAA